MPLHLCLFFTNIFILFSILKPAKFTGFFVECREYTGTSQNLNIVKKVNIFYHSFQKVKPIYDMI